MINEKRIKTIYPFTSYYIIYDRYSNNPFIYFKYKFMNMVYGIKYSTCYGHGWHILFNTYDIRHWVKNVENKKLEKINIFLETLISIKNLKNFERKYKLSFEYTYNLSIIKNNDKLILIFESIYNTCIFRILYNDIVYNIFKSMYLYMTDQYTDYIKTFATNFL